MSAASTGPRSTPPAPHRQPLPPGIFATPRSRELLRAVEQSPVSILITDPTGRIEYANPKFAETTGYAVAEVLGEFPRLMKSGTHPPEFYHDLWQTITSGREWRGEFRNRRKNGELYWEKALISPVHDPNGHVTHFIAIKEDITKQKSAQEELIRARDEAEAASRAKSAFLAIISHELRTPLNAINGVASMLLADQRLAADMHEAVELIHQSGATLLTLIEEVLLFSGLQAGKTKLDHRPFDLLELLTRVVRMVGASQTKAVRLTSWIDPEAPAAVIGDGPRLQQVLLNLLANAFKFTERGRVHIGVRVARLGADACRLECYVCDTGIGIEPEALPRLFQPFIQADASVTRRFGGTGLGLAICKALVNLMDGDITVRSRPGRATVFRFQVRLGLAPNAPRVFAGATSRSIEPDPAPSTQKLGDRLPLRILVVDDIRTNREAGRMMFRSLGYTVKTAEDGADALRQHAATPFDLVLLDLQMPVMDGLTAAQEFHRRYPEAGSRPRLIALTANALPGDRERCLEAGMDEYLTKPVLPKQLAACIERFFGNGAAPAVPCSTGGASARASDPWVDPAHHDAMLGGLEPAARTAMLRELQATLEGDVQRVLPELEAACQARDADLAAELIHGLKGAALMLGWQRMGHACAELLREIRSATFSRWAELPGTISHLHRESARAMAELPLAASAAPSLPTSPPASILPAS